MARQPRYAIPGQPQHIIARGNNRTTIFGGTADYLFFKDCLLSASSRFGLAIHAYVLMTNHVHLLASPRDARGIGKTLQSVGRRYVRYFNDRIGRTGTLWEGRYRATVIDTDEYLFRCCRYIEENPVRAGMVSDSSLYRWSSFAANASGAIDPLVTPHGLYLALGATPPSRQRRYRAIFAKPLDLPGVLAIRRATNHSWALGGEQFQHIVSSSGRRAAPLERGRPRIGV